KGVSYASVGDSGDSNLGADEGGSEESCCACVCSSASGYGCTSASWLYSVASLAICAESGSCAVLAGKSGDETLCSVGDGVEKDGVQLLLVGIDCWIELAMLPLPLLAH